MKRPSYKFAVAWIALNDNAAEHYDGTKEAAEEIAGYLTVALLADVFDVETDKVGRDVARVRFQERTHEFHSGLQQSEAETMGDNLGESPDY